MLLDQYGRPMPTPARRRAVAVRNRRRVEMEAAYDAAQTTSENVRHWKWADSLSAAAANSQDVRRTIRDRARYEIANNSFASGIVDTLANDTIGTGPRLQMQTGDEAANGLIESRFAAWWRSRRLSEKLRTARRAKCGDGEAFLQRTDNRKSRTPITLDVKLVECDLFDDLTETGTDPKHVAGVYFDDDGNPTAYDRMPYHPGDTFGPGHIKPEPMDADDVIHLFTVARPGQIRGISELTPALPLFAMLRRYTLAAVMAAETAADFAAILQTATAPFDDEGNPDIADVDPFDGVQIDRGLMTSLPRGWQLNQLRAEHPTTTYKEFRNAILNEIARCVQMPANKARMDSSEYNYASGRLDHGTYFDAIDIERDVWEIDVCERIFEWWFDEAALIPGYLPTLPTFDHGIPHAWYWPGRQSADPVKDAAAAKVLHTLGLLTDEEFLLTKGIDPEEHYRQLQRQKERRAEIGIDNAGNKPAANGQPSQQAAAA